MSNPTSTPNPLAPAAGTVVGGLARPVAAGLACLFSLISGIVFLLLERKDAFVRWWAMQAVVLGAVAVIAALGMEFAALVLDWLPIIGGLLLGLLKLIYGVFKAGWAIVYLICLVSAFCGQRWEIPWLGRFARQQLARLDLAQRPPA